MTEEKSPITNSTDAINQVSGSKKDLTLGTAATQVGNFLKNEGMQALGFVIGKAKEVGLIALNKGIDISKSRREKLKEAGQKKLAGAVEVAQEKVKNTVDVAQQKIEGVTQKVEEKLSPTNTDTPESTPEKIEAEKKEQTP